MITPGQHNFQVFQGATIRKTFVWTADNVAVDLTGYTGRSQFRQTIESPIVALDLTSDNGGIIIDELTGSVTLHALADDTALLKESKYVYDLELIAPNGDVLRLVQGHITVSKEVTR